MEGESGGVGRGEKMYFVAPGVGIDSLGGFLRSKCAYTRTCDFRDGGPVFFFLFFFLYHAWIVGFDARTTETPCAA